MSETEALLVAAIEAEPDNVEPYRIYADWLLHKGDQLGEIISLHCALASKPPRPQRIHLETFQSRLHDAHPELGREFWFRSLLSVRKFGLVTSLRNLLPRVRFGEWYEAISHPLSRLLQVIEGDATAVCALAEVPVFPKSLRHLRVTDLDQDAGQHLLALAPRLRGLRTLSLAGCHIAPRMEARLWQEFGAILDVSSGAPRTREPGL